MGYFYFSYLKNSLHRYNFYCRNVRYLVQLGYKIQMRSIERLVASITSTNRLEFRHILGWTGLFFRIKSFQSWIMGSNEKNLITKWLCPEEFSKFGRNVGGWRMTDTWVYIEYINPSNMKVIYDGLLLWASRLYIVSKLYQIPYISTIKVVAIGWGNFFRYENQKYPFSK